jgi:cysteine desulfuration protein SufE
MADIDEIISNFAVLDDWDDRYRYLIELGRELPPLAEAAHSDANKVQGCASQVWLDTTVRPNGAGGPVLTFAGDSDAHIVRGLIAILFAVYSGKSAREILNTDAVKLFEGMGLREHLTPQRSNGFRSMVERIRSDARATLAAAASCAARPSVFLSSSALFDVIAQFGNRTETQRSPRPNLYVVPFGRYRSAPSVITALAGIIHNPAGHEHNRDEDNQ